jgi:hypothetical protein
LDQLLLILQNLFTFYKASYFRVGATFEMIRTESDEMCISIDQDCGGAAPFIWREIKQGSRETERECVCVRVLVET